MKDEGYRYVRAYTTKQGRRWALWEVTGGRKRRVGTALTFEAYCDFLGWDYRTLVARLRSG